MQNTEIRIGVVGIVINEPKESAAEINAILSDFSDIVVGRMGIPHRNGGASVIALTVEGTTDQIGAMTGKLGQLRGVSVKSAIAK